MMKTQKKNKLSCFLSLFHKAEMQVFIRLVNGKAITIEVEDNEDVSVLQQRISQKTEENLWCFWRLVHGGRQLAPGRTLAEYNIQREATIHMMGRMVSPLQIQIVLPSGKVVPRFNDTDLCCRCSPWGHGTIQTAIIDFVKRKHNVNSLFDVYFGDTKLDPATSLADCGFSTEEGDTTTVKCVVCNLCPVGQHDYAPFPDKNIIFCKKCGDCKPIS